MRRNRRNFLASAMSTVSSGVILTAVPGLAATALAAVDYGNNSGETLTEVARLPWLCNAVALTQDSRMFVGLPRWPTNEQSPSVAEVMPDGSLKPFPGGDWNDWESGKPTADAFVCVNAIHIFDDDTLWVVDQGSPFFGPQIDREAHKVLQFDTRTGKLLRKFVFDETVLPPGASLNDLRLDAENAYFTDSGAGAIVIVNLKTGRMLRRLAGDPSTKASVNRPPYGENGQPLQHADGTVLQVNSDPIEISPDGKWLYFQPLTGPLYRVPTRSLRDTKLSEAELGHQVEFVYDTPPLTGTAIDSAGNLYLAEMNRPRVTVYTPDRRLVVLAEDDRLWGPDAMIISKQRDLYIPVPQTGRLAGNRGPGGKDGVARPYKIYRLRLPDWLGNVEAVPPASV